MIENPFYTSEFHGEYDLISIGRLDLEEGGTIPDCQLAVTTWGELSEAKDNAILITTWYSGTHQIWRDIYVGPDHALNPERYFIVAINQIGNGLSTSPHNADGPNADLSMSKFPKVRIGDDVVAQERLLREHFGIERLQLVVGGSMAGSWDLVRPPLLGAIRRAEPALAGLAVRRAAHPEDSALIGAAVHAWAIDRATVLGS